MPENLYFILFFVSMYIMTRENIVKILKAQHVEIEKILHLIDNYLEENKDIDSVFVHEHLLKFGEILMEHVTIEDNEFYPDLIEKMKKAHEETGDIYNFIARMNAILDYVYGFLEKYNSPEKIMTEHRDSFRALYIRMMSRLEIRINVEELFVYNKWTKLKSLEEKNNR